MPVKTNIFKPVIPCVRTRFTSDDLLKQPDFTEKRFSDSALNILHETELCWVLRQLITVGRRAIRWDIDVQGLVSVEDQNILVVDKLKEKKKSIRDMSNQLLSVYRSDSLTLCITDSYDSYLVRPCFRGRLQKGFLCITFIAFSKFCIAFIIFCVSEYAS